jgi:hypothetical protein
MRFSRLALLRRDSELASQHKAVGVLGHVLWESGASGVLDSRNLWLRGNVPQCQPHNEARRAESFDSK